MENTGCKNCLHLEKLSSGYGSLYFCIHHYNFVKEPSYFGNTNFKESTLNKNKDCKYFKSKNLRKIINKLTKDE